MKVLTDRRVAFSWTFSDSLKELTEVDADKCWVALSDFAAGSTKPGLRFGPIQGIHSGRGWKIRASRNLRIVMRKVEDKVYLAYLAGPRDQIYERARRGRFVVDRVGENVRFVEPRLQEQGEFEDHQSVNWTGRRLVVDDAGYVLTHWSDSELIEAGFSAAEVATIRSLDSHEDLLALLDAGWDEGQVDLAFELSEVTPAEWRAPDLFGDAAELRLRYALENFGALHGISRLFSPEDIAKIAAGPIEDWMVFLHPDQRAATTRRFEGPALVRGSAGTGKTVVALHWVAERARRAQEEEEEDLPILFTTFVKTLPPVFENLYRRMPMAPEGLVEFVNIDKLAYRICGEAKEERWVDRNAVREAAQAAFKAIVTPGTPLANDGVSQQYLEDEVRKVVKGRGLDSVDEYLHIQRTGRGARFEESRRRQVWEFMEAWDSGMSERGTVDYADVMLRALEFAQARPGPAYRSAVIDEAQDLTLVGLQLVRALVNGPKAVDRPDGLLIVGDGAQRIYPGAFTLRQAGVEVRGRTTVLRQNYRNTSEIQRIAMAVAGRGEVVQMDLDPNDKPLPRDRESGEPIRSGLRPLLVDCGDDHAENEFLVKQIRSLVDSGTVALGDIGVFVLINRAVSSTVRRLRDAGIPAVKLERYDGVPTPEVKVGNYKRSKGLEFKVVFLPRVKAGHVPRKKTARQSNEEYAEQRALELSEFYVAMMRARDQLIVSFGKDPSELLVASMDEFETVTPGDL